MHAESARKILRQQLADATIKADEASKKFSDAIGDVPTSLPDPDGVQHLYNVSQEYATAREKLTNAMRRLNDLMIHGTIPHDLR